MRINFKSVTVKNFLSFGNKEETMSLAKNTITSIRGRNVDVVSGNISGGSNGSGKSTVMQAIVYAVYGEGINSLKQDELVNITNQKGMLVRLELDVDDKPVVICRGRKPNVLTLEVDGISLTRDSLANTNTEIQKLIGVNYDTFVMSYLLTTSVVPLMGRKPAEQRDFIENFVGITLLNERAKTLKTMASEYTVNRKLLERDLLSANEVIARHQRYLDGTQMNFDRHELDKADELNEIDSYLSIMSWVTDELKDQVESQSLLLTTASSFSMASEKEANLVQANILKLKDEKRVLLEGSSKLRASISAKELQLEDCQRDLSELAEAYNETSSINSECDKIIDGTVVFRELLDKISSIEASLKTSVAAADRLYSDREKVETTLSHISAGNCPTCSQEFPLATIQQKIDEYKAQLEVIDGKLAVIQSNDESLLAEAEQYEQQVGAFEYVDAADAKRASNEATMLKSEQRQVVARYDGLVKARDGLRAEIENLNSKLVSFDNSSSAIAEIDLEIEQLTVRLDKLHADNKSANEDYRRLCSEMDSLLGERVTSINDFMSTYNKVNAKKTRKDSLNASINPYESTLSKLKDEAATLPSCDTINQEISAADKVLSHIDMLVKLLTNSKSFIRKDIIGRYIPYLNRMINTYCEQLESPHVCEIKDDLTVAIEYMRKPVSYHSLSAGERLRLDISVAVALRDLQSVLGVKSGFLMVDEVFDSALDANGKKNVFKLVKDRFDTVLLISHSGDFDDKCDSVVTVVKENGFSRFDH